MSDSWLKGRKVIHGDFWEGMEVFSKRGPLRVSYLEDIHDVISHMRRIHPRLMVFRIDLRIPGDYDKPEDKLMTRFFASFNAKIEALEIRAMRSKKRVRHSEVGYIWAKERDNSVNSHFHVAIFLNHDAFHRLGGFTSKDGIARRNHVNNNTYERVLSAWASALRIHVWETVGLVEVPRNPLYCLDANAPDNHIVFCDLFYRLSYLAKVETKVFGRGSRNFGRSQISFLDESVEESSPMNGSFWPSNIGSI